jgi:transposase
MNPSILRNLTLEQWEVLSRLIPESKPGGRKRSVDMQAIALRNPLHLVCGLCMAFAKRLRRRYAPKRFPQVENCVSLRTTMAKRWNMAKNS